MLPRRATKQFLCFPELTPPFPAAAPDYFSYRCCVFAIRSLLHLTSHDLYHLDLFGKHDLRERVHFGSRELRGLCPLDELLDMGYTCCPLG